MLIAGHDFPDDLHYLVEHQVWVRFPDKKCGIIGITQMGIFQAGDIYMCRPKAVGSAVEQGRSIAVVELSKSIVSVKSPVSGTVVEVNPLLEEHPEWVHREPYGRGWIARVELRDRPADLPQLVHGDAVAEAMRRYAWLNKLSEQP